MNPLAALVRRPVERRRNVRRLVIDSAAGVDERGFVMIGGIEQWVTVRGQDRADPVLLLLHGGPGSPYTAFSPRLREWEQSFTVVQWDQPGAGRTFRRHGGTAGRLTLDRIARDGLELTQHLCDRLGAAKVILVGSSLGSLVGLSMVRQRPDLFHAYVGANQNDPDPGSLALTYRLVREAATDRMDLRCLHLLDTIGPDAAQWSAGQFDSLMKQAVRVSSGCPDMVYDLMLPALMFAPDYRLRDLRELQRGMDASLEALFDEVRSLDRSAVGLAFDVPVLFVQGARDIITPPAAARDYLSRLSAPAKDLVVVEGAGHLVEFADPARFARELLTRVRPLAR